MFNLKSFFFLILSLLLISCQNTQPFDQQRATAQWQNRKQILNKINAFQVNGSIAYFSDKTRNYGRFLITQNAPNDYKIKLTSPIGTNVLTINVTPLRAELINQGGEHYTSQNIESLMNKMSTMNIPFNSLHNWLKGVSNQTHYDKLDNAGRLLSTQFIQNNIQWQLNINNYMTRQYQQKDIDLPATIELKNEHERFRLTINYWILR